MRLFPSRHISHCRVPPAFPLVVAAAVLGFTGVACGAFGAHAVAGFVEDAYPDPAVAARRLDNWRTAAAYHLWHALAVFGCGLLAARAPLKLLTAAGGCFAAGVAVFSGSLYLLALTGAGWLGTVTPVGGALLLAGWGLLAAAAWRAGGSARP